jgi:1-acyl-sn-glycerol-3-phosphate acyltransferase
MIFYHLVRSSLGLYLRAVKNFTVEGRDKVPDGPLIVCPNHVNWIDPVVIADSTHRLVYFMAKQELFNNSLSARAYRALGAFPVRRGEVDRQALRRCLDLIRSGNAVGIFPEGTRSRSGLLGRGEPGAAVISLLTGAPIAPVGIAGYNSGRLRVRWGDPIDPRDYGSADARRDRQIVATLTQDVMSRIAALSGQEAPALATANQTSAGAGVSDA